MLLQLFICFSGIFICYLLNGIAIESITNIFGERIFTFYIFMVLIPSIFNFLFAKLTIIIQTHTNNYYSQDGKIEQKKNVPKYMYILCSIFMMSSMLCSNAALGYINYPTQLILKSIKPIPVLFCGICFAEKLYSIHRFMSTLIIVVGVTLFMYQQYVLKNSFMLNTEGEHVDISHYSYGWILVFFSLLSDGLLAATQERMRLNYCLDTHVFMYYINVYTSIVLLIVVIISQELLKFITFMKDHPHELIYLFFFGLTSAIGQNFIYYTITNFGPLSCSIITTTRKFFSVLFSVYVFSHGMSLQMWICVFLVFLGLGFDVFIQYKSTTF